MTDEPTARVWRVKRPINYSEQLQVQGGIAAPLLAGFSLTTVAQLVIGHDHPWFYQWAIAALAASAALFIYTLQLSAIAVGLSATPSERLDYYPEAGFDPATLKHVRQRQWEDTERRGKLTFRAGWCYDLGMLAFLGGLALIIVPHIWNPWPWGRFIGLGALGIAFMIEVVWTLSRGKRPHWLLQPNHAVNPIELDDNGRSYLFAREVPM